MPPAIETTLLTRQFGDFTAVDHVNLTVEAGQFFGFLGPNGAGKSTTIKMLTGLLAPTSGTIHILGADLTQNSAELKRQIGVVPEGMALFGRLTASEYLRFVGRMYGLDKATTLQRTEELLEFMNLADQQKKLVTDFSHGMQKKLALAAAVIHGPKVLFLDEPFEGVDAIAAGTLKTMLQRMIARGATIFLTSHVLEIVERLCTHIGIIHRGQLVAQGSIEELRARRRPRRRRRCNSAHARADLPGNCRRRQRAARAAGTGALVAELDEHPPISATTQLVAIAWMRWRMFANGFVRRSTTPRQMVGLVFTILLRLIIWPIFAMMAVGPAFGAGYVAWSAIAHHHPQYLIPLLAAVAIGWQFVAVNGVSMAAALASFDPASLLRFPLRFGRYLVLRLALGLLTPSTIIGCLALFAAVVGIGLADASLAPAAFVVLAIYAAMNIFFSRMIAVWLERWLSTRRAREIFGVLMAMFFISFQFLNYHAHWLAPAHRPGSQQLAAHVSALDQSRAGLAAARLCGAIHHPHRASARAHACAGSAIHCAAAVDRGLLRRLRAAPAQAVPGRVPE